VSWFHPFYERREDGRGRTVQVRPFYWRRESPDGKKVHLLGPLVRWRENDVYRSLQVFPNVWYTARTAPPELRSWMFLFFPVLVLGHDDFLVFPVGGRTRGLLGLDDLLLVTPLYARARQGKFVAHHVLFPFVSWGTDGQPGGRRRFRVAPFYGRARARDGAESGFVLWPFYVWRRKGDTERSVFVFPFYGRRDTPTTRETTVLFPFYHRRRDFRTGEEDRALWPFWRRAGGADALEVRRLWPFHEYRRTGFTTTEVVAWPFWRRVLLDEPDTLGRLTFVLPFYRRAEYVSRRDGSRRDKTVVWPFVRVERAADGAREVAVPQLLPFDAPALREFAEPFQPFFSLYRRRTAPSGDRDTSYLFGLVRGRRAGGERRLLVPLLYAYRESAAGERRARVLGGLVGWERDPGGRYLRLLWGLRLRLGDPR